MARGHEEPGRGGHRGLLERLRERLGKLGRREQASRKANDAAVPAGTGTGVTMSGHQAGTRVPQQDEPSRRG